MEPREIKLPYGQGHLGLPNVDHLQILAPDLPSSIPKLDLRSVVNDAFDALPHHVRNPVFILPDGTREGFSAQWLQIWRDYFEWTSPPICIFASGIHAPMTGREMRATLGTLAPQFRLVAHDADHSTCRPMAHGHHEPVYINAHVDDGDCLILISAMNWHYLAGFGGGRKMILPGIANRSTATRFHRHTMNQTLTQRAQFVEAGRLTGNPFHEAIVSAIGDLPPIAGVCSVMHQGQLFDAEGGNLLSHHHQLARRFSHAFSYSVRQKTDRLIISAGGTPFDQTLVQVHKSLVNASRIVSPGGQIVLIAHCGSIDQNNSFADEMVAIQESSNLKSLRPSFQIREQTLKSFHRLVSEYDIALVSSLDPQVVQQCRIRPLHSIDACFDFLKDGKQPLAVAPHGAHVHLRVTTQDKPVSLETII